MPPAGRPESSAPESSPPRRALRPRAAPEAGRAPRAKSPRAAPADSSAPSEPPVPQARPAAPPAPADDWPVRALFALRDDGAGAEPSLRALLADVGGDLRLDRVVVPAWGPRPPETRLAVRSPRPLPSGVGPRLREVGELLGLLPLRVLSAKRS